MCCGSTTLASSQGDQVYGDFSSRRAQSHRHRRHTCVQVQLGASYSRSPLSGGRWVPSLTEDKGQRRSTAAAIVSNTTADARTNDLLINYPQIPRAAVGKQAAKLRQARSLGRGRDSRRRMLLHQTPTPTQKVATSTRVVSQFSIDDGPTGCIHEDLKARRRSPHGQEILDRRVDGWGGGKGRVARKRLHE